MKDELISSMIAHINSSGDSIQTIEEHSNNVAKLASLFAYSFESSDWTYIIGQLHDYGKYNFEFQNYIRSVHDNPMQPNVDHSSAGAIYAMRKMPCHYPLSYCITGHHAGLLDYSSSGLSNLKKRLEKTELFENAKVNAPTLNLDFSVLRPPHIPLDKNNMHLWVRMLFSCLVDADYLDTEHFMSPKVSSKRQRNVTMPQLLAKYDAYMDKMKADAVKSDLNNARGVIQSICRKYGEKDSGFYSLTVPTGGGKTLSSLAFALTHAVVHKKERIIIVIPYTSIITQTAAILRNIFGEDNVVEHHSNVETSKDNEYDSTSLNKLSTENWDAPIVVTTNVQFFESLYSCKTSRCRKLHNICDAVLILDEAQILPTDFLIPIMQVLTSLKQCYHDTILFTTATQPPFSELDKKERIQDNVNEIDLSSLDMSVFKRVEYNFPEDKTPMDAKELAGQLNQYDKVLCVVNTRSQAQELFKELDSNNDFTFHLSRMMCTRHIMKMLEVIKTRLKEGLPVRVVSTQLIEAGVDIDFPVVYRAMAGLDSIIQAAGRCNREGRQKVGKVVVFNPFSIPKMGTLRKSIGAMQEIQHLYSGDVTTAEAVKHYFRLFYSSCNQKDVSDISRIQNERFEYEFKSVSDAFQLINDRNTYAVIIPFGEGESLISQLENNVTDFRLMRQMQHYTVSVYEKDFITLKKAGVIRTINDSVYVLSDKSYYDNKIGLTIENKWLEETLTY